VKDRRPTRPPHSDGNADDAKTALHLIDAVEGDIASFTANAAYDVIAIYGAVAARGAKVVVPPIKTATRPRQRKPLVYLASHDARFITGAALPIDGGGSAGH
jgi:hypothetical protein